MVFVASLLFWCCFQVCQVLWGSCAACSASHCFLSFLVLCCFWVVSFVVCCFRCLGFSCLLSFPVLGFVHDLGALFGGSCC